MILVSFTAWSELNSRKHSLRFAHWPNLQQLIEHQKAAAIVTRRLQICEINARRLQKWSLTYKQERELQGVRLPGMNRGHDDGEHGRREEPWQHRRHILPHRRARSPHAPIANSVTSEKTLGEAPWTELAGKAFLAKPWNTPDCCSFLPNLAQLT
jgi:hypothetical protein